MNNHEVIIFNQIPYKRPFLVEVVFTNYTYPITQEVEMDNNYWRCIIIFTSEMGQCLLHNPPMYNRYFSSLFNICCI